MFVHLMRACAVARTEGHEGKTYPGVQGGGTGDTAVSQRCPVSSSARRDEARTRLAFLVQGIRKSLYSSRGAHESVRSVENERTTPPGSRVSLAALSVGSRPEWACKAAEQREQP